VQHDAVGVRTPQGVAGDPDRQGVARLEVGQLDDTDDGICVLFGPLVEAVVHVHPGLLVLLYVAQGRRVVDGILELLFGSKLSQGRDDVQWCACTRRRQRLR